MHGIGSEASIRSALEAEEAEIQRGIEFMNSNVGKAVMSTLTERFGDMVIVSTPSSPNRFMVE